MLKLDKVGRHDNFFALGGHSLLAVTLIERMRRRGFKVDVRSLFATPTIAALAAAVDSAVSAVEVPPNRIPSVCERIAPGMLPLLSLAQQEIDRVVASVPEGACNVQDIYPLAPLQEGILFHYLMGGEGDPYLLAAQFSFASRGRLDSYIAALQAVVGRHDILRTSVLWEGLPEPVQVVWRNAALHIEEIEVDPGAGDAAEQLYARFNPRHFRMDVRQAPLLRLYLAYDRAKDRWLMMQLLHHLAGDHSTLEVMQAEVQAYLLGQQASLPAPLPFRNLVAQARLGVSQEEHEAFFRRMLGDVDEPTAPFGLLDVRGDGGEIEEARLDLDYDLARRLRAHARRLGVSAASLCHLAWAQVLAKVSGRQDVVFGTVLFGRMQGGESADRVMGLFINTLPVRILIGEQSVEASVRRTHTLLADLMRHEHASLALAQRCSAVPAPAPLFSALLNYRHSPGAAQALSAETMHAWEGIQGLRGEERTNYPVTLSVDDLGEGFSLDAQTPASVGPMRVCEFMRTALESLADALEASPSTAVRALEVLPPSERHRILYEWNDTRTEYPSDKCVHELFEQQVAKTPDAVAVVFEEESLSYAELNRRANQLAHHLSELGVKPDDRVAICVERGFEMIVALMAVLKAGGAYVPLDPVSPVERLRLTLADSAPVALLTQSHLRELFTEMGEALPVLDLADAVLWQNQPETNPDPNAIGLNPSHLAYVIYTSGSTGMPKGVMISHNQVANTLHDINARFKFGSDDRVLAISSFAFDLSVFDYFGILSVGGTTVIPPNERHTDPTMWIDLVSRQRITIWNSVPAFMQLLVDSSAQASKSLFNSLRCVMLSGDWFSVRLSEQIRTLCPGASIYSLGGATEASIWSVSFHVDCLDTNRTTIPYGKPLGNQCFYVLDENIQPSPIGIAGELHIGGAGVALGYLNRPELTAEKFLADPFTAEPGARMYRTGDLGRYLPDGNLEFLGRNDFQVKIRGFRIELGEIEARLAEYPDVREAVVIAREDTAGDKRLVAYYTPSLVGESIQETLNAEQLRSYLAAALPEYMVPVAYVRLESLPLTSNGKLDRKSLPVPEGDAYATRGYEPPVGEIEEKLAAVWAEVLKLDRVGRHDNFFALGGHSLSAITLIDRIRHSGFQVDVRTLFAAPTLADLSATVGSDAAAIEVPPNLILSGCEAIAPEMLSLAKLTQSEIDHLVGSVPGGAANVQDIYPLAPLQEGILFHHLMGGEGDAYLLSSLSAVDTREHLDSLVVALQSVVDRHDILRTALAWEGLPEPLQVVLRQAPLPIEKIELDPAAGDASEQLYARFDPRLFRIDLRQAPMLRVCVAFDAGRNRWLLLIRWHHMIGDHTTLEVIQEEVRAHLLGQEDQLPAPLPFRNLVVQARLGVSKEEHEAFFRGMLGHVDEPTAPFGLLDVQGDGSGIEDAHLALDADLARQLRANARRLGVSAASLCHLAWAQVLAKTSGHEDVVFGTVLFGRMAGGEGSHRGIGLFINTLPVRITVNEEGVEAAVRRTHALLADLMCHEHASLALAQRCSAVPAPAPLFTSLLNYRHSPGAAQTPSAEALEAWQGIQGLRAEERTNYPFTLSVNDLGEGFSLSALTPASVGPMRVCAFMRTALESLAEALETTPAIPVSALQVLPASERHRVLYEWNDTKTEYPSDKCVHQLFEEQVDKIPGAIAVVFEDESLSYTELNRGANQLAHYLRELGVGPDDRVAICVERGFEMIVALLAVIKAGGAYVPLDPAYPVDRLRFMLTDSTPVALLTHGHLQDLFAGIVDGLPVLDMTAAAARAWQQHPETNPDAMEIGLTPQHLAYVIYTSGSTGTPKGVAMPHAALSNLLHWQNDKPIDSVQRTMQFAALGFDVAFQEVFSTLCSGSVLVPVQEDKKLNPRDLILFIQNSQTQRLFLPYAALQMLSDGLADMQRTSKPERDIDCTLQQIVTAGEQLRIEPKIQRLFQKFEHCRLQNQYGPTETHVVIAFSLPMNTSVWPTLPPIGRPLSNTQVYILNAHGQPVPVGAVGELYIGGVQVARGYLNRPELTAEKFLKNPFVDDPGARMYRTGDLGRWLADGNIEFLGRNDFQVKIRGFRIELGEIEARLMEHAAVREAVVIAREDTSGDQRLVAYYTSSAGDAMDAEQLRAHLRRFFPIT